MDKFNYHQPTEVMFGRGKVNEIGVMTKKYGNTCLLVTDKPSPALTPLYNKVMELLVAENVQVIHFDEVTPNPTRIMINRGVDLACRSCAQVIIGLGGGSSIDTAKAIAVGAGHKGEAWDYLHYKEAPTTNTLPIIAVTTTSGTGSQTTQCAVITDTETSDKSAIWHKNIYPKVAIVDPELMITLPKDMTAITGFDAMAHNFEGYISKGSNVFTDMMALEGMKLIIETLPKVLNNLDDVALRSKMAWADTIGGLVITQAGVTLPHGLGMQISGHCPRISHGLSLAVTYPEFIRFTYRSNIQKFATVARLFNPELIGENDEMAAEKCCEEFDTFLKQIGLWIDFKALGVSKDEIRTIADCGQVLSDYQNNPKVAELSEMYDMLLASYERV